jgi:hypothetical protein
MGRVADAKSASHGFLGSFVLEEEADMFMLKCFSGCGWLVAWRARAVTVSCPSQQFTLCKAWVYALHLPFYHGFTLCNYPQLYRYFVWLEFGF